MGAASALYVFRGISGRAAATETPARWIDASTARDWQARWEKFVLADSAKNRHCDMEMAEERGRLVGPFLDGFYYGYLAECGALGPYKPRAEGGQAFVDAH